MADKDLELRVVRQSSDGRRRYDERGKRALVEAALRPGVSVARLVQEREKGLVPASQDNDADGCDLPPAVEVRSNASRPRHHHLRSCRSFRRRR